MMPSAHPSVPRARNRNQVGPKLQPNVGGAVGHMSRFSSRKSNLGEAHVRVATHRDDISDFSELRGKWAKL